jgi:predicted ATPase with chaperone activity
LHAPSQTLRGAQNIGKTHLAEALQYRAQDERYWGN